MATKYTFKTIVATEAIREQFTKLRNELGSSDKELMTAFWCIGLENKDELIKFVNEQKEEKLREREEKKAAKRKPTSGKRGRPKGSKNKAKSEKIDKQAPTNTNEKVSEVEDEEGSITVVNGLA